MRRVQAPHPTGAMPHETRYFFFPPFPLCVWERAEPAAAFDVFEVRLSRSVFDAAVAAFFPVVFLWATLHHLPFRP